MLTLGHPIYTAMRKFVLFLIVVFFSVIVVPAIGQQADKPKTLAE
jgi:hypothetical protein